MYIFDNYSHEYKTRRIFELWIKSCYSIYLSDPRHVAPAKSGEDAHVTRGRCDLGGTTLNKPRLGFCYVLPRLWDPGGVRSTPNVPRVRSRTLAPSRYPYPPCKGNLVDLTSLQ